jgi:hypothetical protein
MARVGLPLSSNISIGINQPVDAELRWSSGRHLIDGVMEIPALSYYAHMPLSGPRPRTLAITASSWPETESLLWQARRAGLSPVVLLTHPFEFIKKKDFRYRTIRRNRTNQNRLGRLLSFLNEHRDDFEAVTFGERGARWIAEGPAPAAVLSVNTQLAVRRVCTNLLNDKIWIY